MKKLLLVLVVVAFIVPVMAQDIPVPPEKASAEEWIQYYQQREALANQKLSELEQDNQELEAQLAALQQQLNSVETWTEEEAALLDEFNAKVKEYTVKRGDWLSKLAEYPEIYGKGNYWKWPVIYRANRDQIKNPDLIYPGQVFEIPRVLASEWTVHQGETLRKIASYYEVYYKEGYKRWKEIYEANRDKISNSNVIDAGDVLTIPRP
jgi:nucleoid-associated protein YgaU